MSEFQAAAIDTMEKLRRDAALREKRPNVLNALRRLHAGLDSDRLQEAARGLAQGVLDAYWERDRQSDRMLYEMNVGQVARVLALREAQADLERVEPSEFVQLEKRIEYLSSEIMRLSPPSLACVGDAIVYIEKQRERAEHTRLSSLEPWDRAFVQNQAYRPWLHRSYLDGGAQTVTSAHALTLTVVARAGLSEGDADNLVLPHLRDLESDELLERRPDRSEASELIGLTFRELLRLVPLGDAFCTDRTRSIAPEEWSDEHALEADGRLVELAEIAMIRLGCTVILGAANGGESAVAHGVVASPAPAQKPIQPRGRQPVAEDGENERVVQQWRDAKASHGMTQRHFEDAHGLEDGAVRKAQDRIKAAKRRRGSGTKSD